MWSEGGREFESVYEYEGVSMNEAVDGMSYGSKIFCSEARISS